MFPVYGYTRRTTPFSWGILVVLLLLPLYSATDFSDSPSKVADGDVLHNATWSGFMRFLHAGKGSHVHGMAELKSYFHRFGYLTNKPENSTSDDVFDDEFEAAVISYQRNLGLKETGKLDHETMSIIVSPRCGVAEVGISGNSPTRRYAYFYGEPRWTGIPPLTLTYAVSPANTIGYLNAAAVRAALGRAFARWAAVIPVSFAESDEYEAADIRIGWYAGDHGDGVSFDGVLGILAHAFSPENGRFHLDASETWSVDFSDEKSNVAVDLESVATHEIGHVLGLAHSTVKEAIMYPSLSPRTKKVDLRIDDIQGIQSLYGSNPNYKYDARLEAEFSSGRMRWNLAHVIIIRSGIWAGLFLLIGY